MTTYMTRGPLQPLENPHTMPGRKSSEGRRISARLAEKEDHISPKSNSVDTTPKSAEHAKSDRSAANKQAGSKRKQGEHWTGCGTDSAEQTAGDVLTWIAYDEEDEGFAFSRTRAKKSKPSKVKEDVPQVVTKLALEHPVAPTTTKKRPRKKSFSSPAALPAVESRTVGNGKSTGHSDNSQDAEPPQLTVKKKRRSRDHAGVTVQAAVPEPVEQPLAPVQQPDKAVSPPQTSKHGPVPPQPVTQKSAEPEHHQSQAGTGQTPADAEPPFDATKISLPFADTPIIRRNKEMRKGAQTGSRRSSLGLRGRRASSLIESGKSNGKGLLDLRFQALMITALPHSEVEPSDFYRHIESEGLSEPRRMRQLLMWCGARALGDKPSFNSEDGNARLAGQ